MGSKLMEMIEKRTKPVNEEKIGKVSSHWKLIRDSVQRGQGEDPVKVDKQQSSQVGHGVHKLSSIKSDVGFTSVTYNPSNCQYAGISPEGRITVHSSNGFQRHINRYLNEPLRGIVYASKTKEYAGWGDDENIRLMTEDFKLLSTTSSISKILCGVFNENANEVITGGAGNITCWSFRYGAKFLLQRRVITDGINSESKITHICLEETPSRGQRCFSAYDTDILVHSLLDGKCLAHFKDLHSREITALLFFNPLKYLVTAARDGSIKVWNDKGNIQIIFVGHLKSVNTLAIYPYGPYIMSGSSDKTIRVWSLDTSDEVDRIKTKGSVLGLGAIIGKDNLFSYSCEKLDLWKINHVHSVYTTVGSKVKSMKPSTHPRYPMRMVCTCSDNTVRIISPGSGACITSLLVPVTSTLVDVVYAAADNLLFTLLSNGSIIKASTKTNPCQILEQWNKDMTKVPSTCSCLCLYEYVVEDNLENDQWGDLVRSTLKANSSELEFQSASRPSTYDRTLLLGGCIDGTIVVYDWQNRKKPGSISFLIEAHREEVITMIANPAVDQVISASYDNTIKIWRLFPFAEEALAPLMTLYCQETPKHLAVAHHRLFASLHEPATASYNVVVFKTTQKERFDHNSDNDHTDDVTGVASCPKMRLFASSSADGSIKIWDESNHLLRVITLNAIPNSLCFSSQKGDLLIGIGNHLHRIGYATYMPRSYIYRMVAMEFQRPVSENPIPIEPEVKMKLSPDEYQRLTRAKSSVFKFERFADLLSPEEMDEKALEEERRNEAFSKIRQRENELQKLRDGVFDFEKRKRRPNSEMVRQDAFDRYLAIFYKRPDVEIPDEDEFDKEECEEFEPREEFTPNRGRQGFFGIDKNSRQRPRTKPKDERPVVSKHEIMSLSMPEFQPFPAPPTDSDQEQGDEEEEDGRQFVVSRQGTYADMDADSEVDQQDLTSQRSKSVAEKTTDYRAMSVGPPLLGSPKRDRYIVDVPKTERYPSSTTCRHMVARRAARLASRHVSDRGEEEFVVAPDGFIPNSVVVAIFKDLKSETPAEDPAKIWRPPSLTAEQLAEIEKRKKKRPPTPEEEPPAPRKSPKKPNRFSEQMKLALRDTPSPEPEIELMKSPTPTPTPPPSPPPKEPTPPPTPKPTPMKPVKPIEKLITRPKPPTPPPTTPVSSKTEVKPVAESNKVTKDSNNNIIILENKDTAINPIQSKENLVKTTTPELRPTPPREPTPTPPPPPPTPLPEFITQFKGTLWFEKYFPDAGPETFPKPWSIGSFVDMLLQVLQKCSEHELKTQILAAIMLLNRQDPFDKGTCERVSRVLLAELNVPDPPSAHGSSAAKQFLRVSIQLLQMMKIWNKSFVAEMMSHYIDGDEEVRDLMQEIFTSIGIRDPGRYFPKELDNFETEHLVDKRRKARLREICLNWLEKWLTQFKQHIESLAGKIGRAQSGSVVKGTKAPKTPSSIKGILKKDDKIEGSSSNVKFDIENMGKLAAESATPVEAINYFCEMEMEAELARARERSRVKTPQQATDNSRNTVLILPKIHSKRSLARLGETHCSQCHPQRETSLALAFPLPPIYHQKKEIPLTNVSLHLKTLTLNPFPDEADLDLYESTKHAQLITLRSSQKYFIPSQSIVTMYDDAL